jgi:enoyl-CoA hydratase/carnithine racemase
MSYADGKMLAEVADGVGLITFNQPEKRNAMSVEMWSGLVEILENFAVDEQVRVVVLTGAGDKAFVSGADISQFAKQRSDADAQVEYDKITSVGREKLAVFAKPVIARIRGFCLGGGLGIAMQADLRIAAEDSQFGIPAAKLGIGYGFDMVSKLVSLVGPAHAKTLLYSGERIDGAEAARIGLVNRVVPNDQLEDIVMKMARSMAINAPLSLRAAKIAVGEALKVESQRNVGLVHDAVAACFDSADYREGRTAFMEKRKPVFKGA